MWHRSWWYFRLELQKYPLLQYLHLQCQNLMKKEAFNNEITLNFLTCMDDLLNENHEHVFANLPSTCKSFRIDHNSKLSLAYETPHVFSTRYYEWKSSDNTNIWVVLFLYGRRHVSRDIWQLQMLFHTPKNVNLCFHKIFNEKEKDLKLLHHKCVSVPCEFDNVFSW